MKPHILKISNKGDNLLKEYSNLTYFTTGVLKLYGNQLTALQDQISKTLVILKSDNNLK